MLDECVRRSYDWHIRMDDDCFITTKNWLKRLLATQEEVRKLSGKYCVMSMTVNGLKDPPPSIQAYEMGRETVEHVGILGGIFRMSPMYLLRYFRWDERQAMGFGDATQMVAFCDGYLLLGSKTPMLRVVGVKCTHGDSTKKQEENSAWAYEHDMLQYMPLGL